MKGYYTESCYMGWMPCYGRYMPFVSDTEYAEEYRKLCS